MGPVRILILVVALAAAVGAVVLMRGMSKAQPQVVVAAAPAPTVIEKPTSLVLVAKHDLRPGWKLQADDMTWQTWPAESLNPAFIVQASAPKPKDEAAKIATAATNIAKTAVGQPDEKLLALVGAMVREPILASEPMTERKLVRAGTAGMMAVSLDSGMRAMAIPLSAESAAGGFILPGDHVDVVQSRQLEGGGSKHFTSATVLKNVRVLAIDQNTDAPKGAAVVGATATLEVNPSQAEVLTLAKSEGSLTLVLRSYADISGPAVTVAQSSEGAFRAAVVRVYRNGQASETMVSR